MRTVYRVDETVFVIFVVVIVADVIAGGVVVAVAVVVVIVDVVVVVVVVVIVVVVVVVVVIGITYIIGITSDGFLSFLGVIYTYVLQRGPVNNNNTFVLYNCGQINQASTSYKGLEQFCVQLCSSGFLGC